MPRSRSRCARCELRDDTDQAVNAASPRSTCRSAPGAPDARYAFAIPGNERLHRPSSYEIYNRSGHALDSRVRRFPRRPGHRSESVDRFFCRRHLPEPRVPQGDYLETVPPERRPLRRQPLLPEDTIHVHGFTLRGRRRRPGPDPGRRLVPAARAHDRPDRARRPRGGSGFRMFRTYTAGHAVPAGRPPDRRPRARRDHGEHGRHRSADRLDRRRARASPRPGPTSVRSARSGRSSTGRTATSSRSPSRSRSSAASTRAR